MLLKKSLLKEVKKKVERIKKNKPKNEQFFIVERFPLSMMYIHTFLIDFILTKQWKKYQGSYKKSVFEFYIIGIIFFVLECSMLSIWKSKDIQKLRQ